MACRFTEEIAAAFLLVAAWSPAAWTKEEFVSYKAAQNQLDAVPATREVISVDELHALLDKGTPVVVFDARTKNEFEAERLAGSKLPRSDAYYEDLDLFQRNITRTAPSSRQALEKAMEGMDREAALVTYCRSHCGLSKNLMLDLQALGFKNVRWLDGGIDVWREKGYPLEKK